MNRFLDFLRLLALGVAVGGACWADETSGPNHITLLKTSWGAFFFDAVALGPHQAELKPGEIRVKSSHGEVRILGSEANGFEVLCGRDRMTVRQTHGDLDLRWGDKVWSLKSRNAGGGWVLTTTAPSDRVLFERNANTFTIAGTRGSLSGTSQFGTVTLQGPSGKATLRTAPEGRSHEGIPLDQMPYLGRGLYISFHGLGVLIDMARLFPTPEISDWQEWRPVLGDPFEPRRRR